MKKIKVNNHFHVPYSDKRFKQDVYTCLCGFESKLQYEFNKHLGKSPEFINDPVSVTEK